MQRIKKLSSVLYFFICPCELVLNIAFGSSTKYVGLLLFIVWLIEFLHNRNNTTFDLNNSSILSLLIWLVICVFSLVWGNSSNSTSVYLTTYLEMGLLVIILTQTIWTEKDINHFLLAYTLGSVFLSIIFIKYGETRYVVRTTIIFMGKQIDPNQLAANITPGAVILLGYIINKNIKIRYRLISTLAFLLVLYTIFMTGSRGGLVSLGGGLIFVYFLQLKEMDAGKFVLLCFSMIIVWCSLSLLPSETADRLLGFDSYTDTYSNGENRLTLWKSMLDDFDAQWMVGHGVGSTIAFFQNIKGRLQGVHNTFLLVIYEVGIVGFIFWFFPYISMLNYNISKRNHVVVGVLVASLLSSFFLDSLNLRYIWNALIICIMKYNCDGEVFQSLTQTNSCKYIKSYIRGS